ncbi:neutral zinc metallopeptidase [Nocardioides ungokensis]|uniref:neutral zinc metallopeptidase n=1 Tax=Nocardioides ungokensis TaxID=1643322 RepID=UPI001FE70EFF|nr:neutral zinc metallopeptidase [Nocardioides ungokensis]
MRFNPKARLDTRRMGDAGRGRRGGGGLGGGSGAGIPIPGGMKAGGGIGGVIIIVLFLVLTQCMGDGGSSLPGSGGGLDSSRMAESGRYDGCKTGTDANDSADCARVAVENSLYDYWSTTLPDQSDASFHAEKKVETFTGSIGTGCGQATSDVGRSTAPPTRPSTSTPRSSARCCSSSWADPVATSSSPMSSHTSTATTSRTCSARWGG